MLHRAIARGGKKFLNGDADVQLAELVTEVGADQVLAWLLESPDDLGVPWLVGWLCDQRTGLDPEFLAALEARSVAPEPEPTAPVEPTRPALAEYRAPAHDQGDPAAAAEARRIARQNLKRDTPTDPVGGRIPTSTGGIQP